MAGKKWGRTLTEQTIVKTLGGELRFRFKDVHLNDYAETLEGLGLRMGDLEPVFREWGSYLVEKQIPATFAARGRPKRWAKLSPAYAMRRFGGRDVVATLVLSGAMKRGFRFEAHKRSMRITNRRFYWTYHHMGAPRANLPQRLILVLLKQDINRFLTIAHDYLVEQGMVTL